MADADLVSDLADAVMDGRPAIPLQGLAEGLGVDYNRMKRAARAGLLPVVRVSPRRLVVTRAGLVAYLNRHNDITGAAPVMEPTG